MAVSMNRVIIAGNLARDPELKYTNSGKAVANFTVAVNDYFSQNASFFRVVVWEKVAENCNQYLSKGSPVLVEGRLQSRSYEVNGEKRSSVEIVAQNVQFLSSGPRDGRGGDNGSYGRKNETELAAEVKRKVESEEEFYDADQDDDIPF